jgi:5-methylcytosine-specific restriction enzyme A
MSRSVPEWIGKDDNTAIPPRVKQRVYDQAGRACQSCGVPVAVLGAFDHKVALINGGENRESNIQFLCIPCHAVKTKADVKVKSKAARIAKKRLGLTKPKRTIPGRRFNGEPIPSRVR